MEEKEVPLVVYNDGERIEVGTAIVENGDDNTLLIRGKLTHPKLVGIDDVGPFSMSFGLNVPGKIDADTC